MNFSIKQIWIFITSIAFFATLMFIDFTFAKKNYLDGKNEELEQHFDSFLSLRKSLSNFLIEDIAKNPKTEELMFKMMKEPENRELYRKKLEELFKDKFAYLKANGFDYFHFHDTKGKSFLRLHNVNKFDDDLTQNRPSIVKMLSEQKTIFGIETASLERYRSIYPIFYKNIYVGSVEISSSLAQLMKELNSHSKEEYLFITKKEFVDKVLSDEVISRDYSSSWLKDFYISKEAKESNFSDIDLKVLGASLDFKLKQNESFSLINVDEISKSTIFIFKPVANFGNKIEGYLISKEKTNGLNQLIRAQLFSFLTLSLLILGAITIYRHLQKRHDENVKIFEQYKTIMDQSVIVSKTDPKGIITFVNEQFCKISGYSKDELIGKSHNIIRHSDSTVPFFKQMWKTILSKKIWQGVIKNKAKDGKNYYVQSTIAPILNEKNEIIEFIALREDITDFIVKNNIFKQEKERINNFFNHISEILIIKKDEKFEQISQKFFDVLPFNNLHEFNMQHHYISELFIQKEGYLENMKSDKWIQDLLNNPDKIHKALIEDKNKELKTFWVKVQKIPFEKTYYYLFTLIDISAIEKENLSKKVDLFVKTKEELKLPEEIIFSLVDKFLISSQEGLIKIKVAIKEDEKEQIKLIIHNIKGSAATLRFGEIASIAEEIENTLAENSLEMQLKNIQKIEEEIMKIKLFRENR